MPLQRVTMKLTELRCIAQSEGSGGSEPYLWVTYYGYGVEPWPGMGGPVMTNTPAYDAFRTEFPDGVRAGASVPVPAFLAEGFFDIELARPFKHVGCIVVLLEQDSTPQSSIVLGRIAYAKEIANQLNAFVTKRVQAGDDSPITDPEIDAIRKAVTDKATSAIAGDQFAWGLFRDQDDSLGFGHVDLGDGGLKQLDESPTRSLPMDFKELGSGSDRYALSGIVSIQESPSGTGTIDLCARERAAVEAKKKEVRGLQTRQDVLQQLLVNAPPGQKAAIVAEITATNQAITSAEQELQPLLAALELCIDKKTGASGTGSDTNVIRDPLEPR